VDTKDGKSAERSVRYSARVHQRTREHDRWVATQHCRVASQTFIE